MNLTGQSTALRPDLQIDPFGVGVRAAIFHGGGHPERTVSQVAILHVSFWFEPGISHEMVL